MEDDQIEEIYQLARETFNAGEPSFQVQAFPFRMTEQNLARHTQNPHMPFWWMLKEGSDHFEAIKKPPKVDVCAKRYVFNAEPLEDEIFQADKPCPPYKIPDWIASAVAAYRL